MVARSHTDDNKRLAKNTLVLYTRTAFVMLVQLFATRIVLKALGADDFGIFNVVGGMVVLFSFISSAMATASQRFINYELGRGEINEVNRVFCASMTTQIALATILFAIIEIIGFWLLNYRLNIPADRIVASNWVFQFSMVIFFFNTIRIPYEGSIIAYENMSFYAWASVIDVLLKLIIALLLLHNHSDRLIFYGGLLMIESIVMFVVYRLYCIKKYNTCRYSFVSEKKLYKQLFSYMGWTVFGSGANILTQQGLVFLINIFYGVVVNAAFGIANQVNTAIVQFFNSFQISYRPQIVTSYAQGDIEHLNRLITLTSKFSFSLIIIPSLILIFNMPLILGLWLSDVPQYCVEFCQIIIICTIIDAITGSYNAAIMATSQIRNYQFAISLSFVFDLILSFILIKLGVLPYLVLLSRIATRGLLNMFIGLIFISQKIKFNVKLYLQEVIFPIVVIMIVLVPLLILLYWNTDGWPLLVFSIIYIVLSFGMAMYYLLLNKQEKKYLAEFVRSRIRR